MEVILPHCGLVCRGFESSMSWDTNPLYALLHEAIYCQGAASNWAAHRVRQQQQYAEEFDAVAAAEAGGSTPHHHSSFKLDVGWMLQVLHVLDGCFEWHAACGCTADEVTRFNSHARSCAIWQTMRVAL
jgi:hypothetical protein